MPRRRCAAGKVPAGRGAVVLPAPAGNNEDELFRTDDGLGDGELGDIEPVAVDSSGLGAVGSARFDASEDALFFGDDRGVSMRCCGDVATLVGARGCGSATRVRSAVRCVASVALPRC